MKLNASKTPPLFGRILCALFAFICMISFTACTGRKGYETETRPPAEDAHPTQQEAASTPAPTQNDAQPTEDAAVSPQPAPNATVPPATVWTRAKYLGVYGYGSINASTVLTSAEPIYRFLVDGKEVRYSIKNDKTFTVQNALMRGRDCRLIVKNGRVEAAVTDIDFDGSTSPVAYQPGLRTLKNFLAASIRPLGETLYVYGGGWNWQDDGASALSCSIGTSPTYGEFFRSQTADYRYKDESDKAGGYYPFGGWNEYWFAGLDCSGYVGWAVYNTLESESGRSGYVYKSTEMAKTYASLGLGSFSAADFETEASPLLPGDIVSLSGHTYIVIGHCNDGSLIILHSSPTESVTGAKGGGVQFSAIDRLGRGKNCDAYKLASEYQSRFYPEWASRYPVEMRSFDKYVAFKRNGTTGVFRWYNDKRGLADPDGFASMSAEEILKSLFGE